MLDINLFRVEKGGNPELIRESQRKRGASVELVDEIIRDDEEWRKARFNADEANKSLNKVQKEIGMLMKKGEKEKAKELMADKIKWETEKARLDDVANGLEVALNKKLMTVGNLVHDSCVDSKDEKDNEIIKKWWPSDRSEQAEIQRKKEKTFTMKSHHEVLDKLGGYDQTRGTKVAGHRGYFLMNAAVDLNLALIKYGLDFLESKGYTKLWTPFFMKKDVMAKTAQLEEFDEALYKIVENEQDQNEDTTKYMIATVLFTSTYCRANNPSLPFMRVNGLLSLKKNFPRNTLANQLALEKKQVHTEETRGESLESINSKRWSNLCFVNLKSRGTCMKRC
jgi:seryl-tRNA synthetase